MYFMSFMYFYRYTRGVIYIVLINIKINIIINIALLYYYLIINTNIINIYIINAINY